MGANDKPLRKLTGSTYTPREFADFVSRKILETVVFPTTGRIKLLDPAVGEGDLLSSFLALMPPVFLPRIDVYGFDIDENALAVSSKRLSKEFPMVSLRLEHADFLDHPMSKGVIASESQKYHVIIANPPYVRIQLLDSERVSALARNYGVSGRFDLYFPFLVAISRSLSVGGVAGIITSNRFLSTKSGSHIRKMLPDMFRVMHVWDFGDTKIFDAAVLPAVMLCKHVDCMPSTSIGFSSIYESSEQKTGECKDAFSALNEKDGSVLEVESGKFFKVRHGQLHAANDGADVWRMSSPDVEDWLSLVKRNTWNDFSFIGKVRVGVKSTADKIFVRDDWDSLSCGRPELLRPLTTKMNARRYAPLRSASRCKEILYPHEVENGKRRVSDLSRFPVAKAYLDRHRSILESRKYVAAAGRQWFEIWVPQDPSAWMGKKLVFLDITEKPVFWMDDSNSVVNGECFWIKPAMGIEEDLLWLALSVANSSFIEEFYDKKFNNRLYAGRRRFVSQYVEKFPLPDPSLKNSLLLISLVKMVYEQALSGGVSEAESELDKLVWQVFGF